MSRIDELIEELCPEGVPWRAIGSFATCIVGATPSSGVSDYWDGGDIPWMSSGEVNRKTITYTEKSITQKGFDSSSTKLVPPNSVVIALAGQGKTRGLVAKTRIALCTNQSLCAMTCDSTVLPDYLFYFLSSRYLELRGLSAGEGGRGGLNLQIIRNYSLPIPPLEVQAEIVSILDKFTQLEAELEAELEARRIQYEVTRDRLLDFSGDLEGHPLRDELNSLDARPVSKRKLGEVGQFIRGSALEKKDLLKSGEPVVHYGEVHTHYGFWTTTTKSFVADTKATKMRKAAPGDVVIVTTSENHEDVGKPLAWLGDQPLNVGGESYIYQSELDPLYVAQLLMSSSFKRTSRRYISGTKVKRLSSENLERIEIPVPPLEIQRKIGVALKDLDALLNDITIGLPAEIAARRKQYEYYRSKLLTFKEVEAA